MKYTSTRNKQNRYGLREAAFLGLAPDGGLFMPERIPAVDMETVLAKSAESYNSLAKYLANLFFEDDLTSQQIAAVIDQAYDFAPELTSPAPGMHTLELFHGPTLAFKDFGARFMGRMLGVMDKGVEQDLIILTATSGDTGSAVAAGFYQVPGIKVILMYPADRVSPLQESQMTTLGENILPLRVNGNFDDCQRMAKKVFSDHEYCAKHRITSANSINLLRWIPQSFYYFYGYYLWLRATGLEPGTPVEIVVPSGNYGNLSAGILARRMGLPVIRFVAATNANDVFPHYLKTGEYQPRESLRTAANAMDVGDPSNYERIQFLFDGNYPQMTAEIEGFSASDEEIKEAIREIHGASGYFSDPHSAVGYLAARHFNSNGFWLSTAHESKFREVLKEAIPAAETPKIPERLAQRAKFPIVYTPLSANVESLRRFIGEL